MRILRRVVGLLDLVVPPTCAACRLPGAAICAACAGAIAVPHPVGCARCGHPWAVSTPRCAECPPAVDRLQFAAAYVDPLPVAIGALKDHGRRDLASELAGLIASRCVGPPRGVGLTPVPLTRDRERVRGFNQAGLIAAHLAQAWDLPVVHLLQRVRDDPPQRGASATDRTLHVRGAFAVAPELQIPPEVWLVDDVCTTGATLAACARTLRRAGVRRVGAVAVARVLRQP